MASKITIADPVRRARFEDTIGHPVHVLPVPYQVADKRFYLLDTGKYTSSQLETLASRITSDLKPAAPVTVETLQRDGCPILSDGVTLVIDDLPTLINLGELAAAESGCGPGCPEWMGDGLCKLGLDWTECERCTVPGEENGMEEDYDEY